MPAAAAARSFYLMFGGGSRIEWDESMRWLPIESIIARRGGGDPGSMGSAGTRMDRPWLGRVKRTMARL